MKKIFLIYGHYSDKSFNEAIKNTITKTAEENGHNVESVELYNEKLKKINTDESSNVYSTNYPTNTPYPYIIIPNPSRSNVTDGTSNYDNFVRPATSFYQVNSGSGYIISTAYQKNSSSIISDIHFVDPGDTFQLYSALRYLNPSPYMYYLNLDECNVVGSSPEILVRVEGEDITLRPIAGTRKRGVNEDEDLSNEKDLLSDPKELAEHMRLIELGRTDVGKMSKIGSVEDTAKRIVERYAQVRHNV